MIIIKYGILFHELEEVEKSSEFQGRRGDMDA